MPGRFGYALKPQEKEKAASRAASGAGG
jgi:hypothetical protein